MSRSAPNPYEVLGVTPSASTAEIETRYRLLLREFHPDVHQHEGPEAILDAERMTRELNDAIARIRSGEAINTAEPKPPWQSPPSDPVDEAVPCPFCGMGFVRLDSYESHLSYVHRMRTTISRPPVRGGFIDTLGKVRYVPAWLVTLVALVLWMAAGFFWFVGAEAFLALVLWAQTSKRFKGRTWIEGDRGVRN